jgi:alpha-ketoglutarate-dependent taurine dioxygenase
MPTPNPSVAAGFEVIRLGGNIGAEIRGLDLTQPLAPPQFEALHAAFVRHEVLVFREQDITLEQQMAFGRLFGELSIRQPSPTSGMRTKPSARLRLPSPSCGPRWCRGTAATRCSPA